MSGLPSPLQSKTATPPPTKNANGPSYVWASPAVAVSSTNRGGPAAGPGADCRLIPTTHAPAATAAMVPSAAVTTAARSRVIRDRADAGTLSGLTDGASRRDLAGVELLGQCPCLLAALRADDPAVEIVGLDVDPAEQPRLAGLIGGVVVRRPFEPDIGRRALLVLQRAGLDRIAADAAREVLTAGEGRHDLRGSPAERAVTRCIALEGRCHERRQLVGDPIAGQHPDRAGGLRFRVGRGAAPGLDRDLADRRCQGGVALAGSARLLRHHLDQARNERQALRGV